jgi:hypothetical protein
MVYAKADRRWAGADLTVVSLELLTVLGAGPLALWICWGIARGDPMVGFWMVVLATGELYGGMFFFAPFPFTSLLFLFQSLSPIPLFFHSPQSNEFWKLNE